jgi:hypothetical protein
LRRLTVSRAARSASLNGEVAVLEYTTEITG